ncbi:MAG: VCBS repeat-containing protein, partial [Planctomycetota bacterium]
MHCPFVLSTLVAASAAAPVTATPILQDPARARTAPAPSTRWIDLDRDGLVDILHLDPASSLRVLANQGDGRFQEATVELGLGGLDGAFDAVWADVDANGHAYVLVLATEGRSRLLRGERGSAFVDVVRECGLDLGAAVRAARWLDVDGDELPELLLTVGETQVLHRNLGGGVFATLDVELPADGGTGAVVTLPAPVAKDGAARPAAGSVPSGSVGSGGGSARAAGPSNVLAL